MQNGSVRGCSRRTSTRRSWRLGALAFVSALALAAACKVDDSRFRYGETDSPSAGDAGESATSTAGSAGKGSSSGGAHAAGKSSTAGSSNSAGSSQSPPAGGSSGLGGASASGGSVEAGGDDSGTPAPECEPSELRCDPDSGLIAQTCSDDGQWEGDEPCPTDTPVCLDGVCLACTPDERACLFGVPQLCTDDGEWAAQSTCPASAPSCLAETGECGTCEPGERQCGDPTTPEECGADGSWTELEGCDGSTPVCFEGECAACDPAGAATRRCLDGVPQACGPKGTWVPEAACTEETPRCLPSTGRCVCDEGDLRCRDGNTPERCNAAGQWLPQSDCTGETPACSGEGVCGCMEGRRECQSATTARVCDGGVWTVDYCLGTNTPACHQGACVQCIPNDQECTDSKTLRTCGTSATWTSQTCPALCYEDACYNPRQTSGAVACDWVRPQVCEGTASCCLHDLGLSRCLMPGETCDWQGDCDGPNDCTGSGQVCCFESGASGVDLRCASGSACDTPDPNITTRQRVCDPLNPVCPSGKTCVERTEIPRMPVFTCQ